MKDKVLTLIIGILIGAILATGGFLIYTKSNSNHDRGMRGGPGNMQSEDFKGQKPSGNFKGEKPDGEPPAKQGENSNTTNNENSSNSNTNSSL